MKRTKRVLSLEEFEFNDELPLNAAPLEDSAICDADAAHLLDDIRTNQEAGVAMEAIANTLRREDPALLGKTSLKMANLAFGAFADKATVAIEEMPIAVDKYDGSPKIVVDQGIEQVQAGKEKVFDAVRQSLSELLVTNARKREALQTKLKEIRANWHKIDEAIGRGLVPDPQRKVLVSGRSDNLMLMYSGQIVDGGATVMPDLCHFLTEHSHLFKRLIKKQTDWLADHKHNVLRTAKGFDSYTFNPVEYIAHGASVVKATKENNYGLLEGECCFRSSELPGMVAFYTLCQAETCTGLEAVDALSKAWTNFSAFDAVSFAAAKTARFGGSDQETVTVLTKEEVQARLAETKRAIDSLEHWGQIAFIDLWKEACFEEEVLASLIKVDAEGLNERLLGELAFAVLKQLNEATNGVVGYVTHVLDAMLGFLDYVLKD